MATATARSGLTRERLVQDGIAYANTQVGSSAAAEADVNYHSQIGGVEDVANRQAASLNALMPGGNETLAHLADNAVLANYNVVGTAGNQTTANSGKVQSDIVAAGVLSGSHSPDSVTANRNHNADIAIDIDDTQTATGQQNLLVSFLNPTIGAAGFDQATLTVLKEGAVVLQQTFSGVTAEADALAFLGNTTHDLGAFQASSGSQLDVDITLDVRTDGVGEGLSVEYVIGNSQVTPRAVPVVQPDAVDTGEFHIGDDSLTAITLSNVAAAGSDGANAAFTGTAGDGIDNGGSVANLGPGASDGSSLQVGIDTATVGNKSGTVAVTTETDGAVTGGGAETFATEQIAVSGSVFALATPSVGSPIDLGERHVGDLAQAALSIANGGVADGFHESLDASFAGSTPDVTGTAGSIDNLGPGASDNSSMSATLDTATAGAKSGTVDVAFVSDPNGINGLGQTALGSQTVALSVDVFRLAEPDPVATPVNAGQYHVGDSIDVALSVTNGAANDGFSESLDAAFTGASTGDVTGTAGSIDNLGPTASDNASLVVSLSSASVGSKSGTADVNFVSDPNGINSLGSTDLGDRTYTVNAEVYRLAEDQVSTPVALGEFHVGDATSAAITVSNTAANDGFSEGLDASFTGSTTGAVTGTAGSIDNLGPGASDNSSMSVDLSFGTAGAIASTAQVQTVSDGDGVNALGQTALGTQTVTLNASVFNLADPVAATTTVDLGDRHVGDSVQGALDIVNAAPAGAFSESLNASFTGTNTGSVVSATGAIANLAAGASDNTAMVVGLDNGSAGVVSGTAQVQYVSDPNGINSLGTTDLGTQTFSVSANLYELAQPSVQALLDFGMVLQGSVQTQAITVTNTDLAGTTFQESLNAAVASFGGDVAAASGAIGHLLAGDTDSVTITATLNTATVGNKAGTVTIALSSEGFGDSANSLGVTDLGTANTSVIGSVETMAIVGNLAVGSTTPTLVDFGNVRTGDAATQAVSVENVAMGPREGLNTAIGGTTGDATGSGAFTGLGFSASAMPPAAVDNTSILVGIDTAGAGAKSGQVTLDHVSNGEFNSGTPTDIADETVDVQGNVFLRAEGPASIADVVIGNFHVTALTAGQSVAVTNTAADTGGFTEGLAIGSLIGTGPVTVSNLLGGTPIAQGATQAAIALDYSLNTAGSLNTTVEVQFQTDGTGTSGLANENVGGAVSFDVIGAGFNLAEGDAAPTVLNFAAKRVGDTAESQTVTVSNTAPVSAFTETLTAAIGTAPANYATSTGQLTGIAGGGNDTFGVTLNTDLAGDFNGQTLQIGYTSAEVMGSGLGNTALGNQSVTLNGKVYQTAVLNQLTTTLDFGIVHVGDAVATQGVGIQNDAAGALNDAITGGFASVDGPFQGSGDLGAGVAAGSSSSALRVGLDTAVAGAFSGQAMLDLFSSNPDLADLALAGEMPVSLSATVNNYANPEFFQQSGDGVFSGAGNAFTLDFGTVMQGNTESALLAVMNNVTGPADLLDGLFADAVLSFVLAGFDPFADLGAGDVFGGLSVSFDTMTLGLGLFEETVTLMGTGHNASGYSAAVPDVTLTLRGRVVGVTGVPEPQTLALVLAGVAGVGWMQRRRARRAA
ncbi:MAG: choice-of-anchor D domain-containing protein [Alphaproteobacteria bacterium]|nr:choice-of-anchor D domain-containing protein [Alphaproteobacteria bacterium]